MNRKFTLVLLIIFIINLLQGQEWQTIPGPLSSLGIGSNNKSAKHYVGYIYGFQGASVQREIVIKLRNRIVPGLPQFNLYESISSPFDTGFLSTDFVMKVAASGDLYMYFGGSSELQSEARVGKYNGNNWQDLGNFQSANSTDLLNNKTLAVTDSGIPYLGLNEVTNSTSNVDGDGIFRYNGNSWEPVGAENFPSGVAHTSKIFFDSEETPHVFYNNGQLVLLKFNGDSWDTIDNNSIDEEFDEVFEIAFGASNRLYAMGLNKDLNQHVVKFFDGVQWIDTNFFGVTSEMKIDGLGVPIVSGNNEGRFFVQRFESNEWVELGTPNWIDNLAIDGEGHVILLRGQAGSYPGFETQFFDGQFVDTESPVITECNELSIENNDLGMCSSVINLTPPIAIDNLTNSANIILEAVRSDGLDLEDPFSVGETTIIWTAIDETGNRSNPCEQTVRVIDEEIPLAICSDVTIELNSEGTVSISPELIDGGSTDNCGVVSLELSKNVFLIEDIGNNPVTLTVTDNSGNSVTCNAIVTIIEPVFEECTDVLPNEDVVIQLPEGRPFLGIDEVFGTDNITNGSSCALGLRNNNIDEPFANYRIPINLSTNEIRAGDELFISIDGYSLEGIARIEILQNNTPNQAIFSNTFNGDWTTASTTIVVPSGLNSLDIWLYSNYLSSNPGTAYYDNLTVINLSDSSTNSAPTAIAGNDQTLTDTDNNGSELVTLDGSESFDLDGSIVGYSWSDSEGEIANTVRPVVDLPVGVNIITLTVFDNQGLSDSDEVLIIIEQVEDNQAPIANAGANRTITDTDGNGSEDVVLNGAESFDADGSIVSYSWKINDNEIGSGLSPTVNLPLGINNIELIVTDNLGAIGVDTVIITVVEETADCPDVLVNENSNIILPTGAGFLGIDTVEGTSKNTNNSPCALIISNSDIGQPFANYRIPIDLSSYGISPGDRLFISLDGNSSLGVSRIEVNQNNQPNSSLASNTFTGGWSTFSATIVVPAGINSLDLWLYSNYLSNASGQGLYDNLIVENLDSQSNLEAIPKLQVRVHPNAAKETVNMTFDRLVDLQQIQIFDLGGKLVRIIQTGGLKENYEFTVDDLPNGTYIIKAINDEGDFFTERVAVLH